MSNLKDIGSQIVELTNLGPTSRRRMVDTLNVYSFFLRDSDKLFGRFNSKGSAKLLRELKIDTDRIISKLYNLEKHTNLENRKKARILFRKYLGIYFFKSNILKRFYEKPFGYAGDHVMFELIYDNIPISKNIGACFDKYILNFPLIKSVISRKNFMIILINKFIEKYNKKEISILNIGSGSCRELKDYIPTSNFKSKNKRIRLTLLDQDEKSLVFSKRMLCSIPNQVPIETIKANVLSFLNFEKMNHILNGKTFDFVYSMGLVDYFKDQTLLTFVKNMTNFLKPGGEMVIAACSSNKIEGYAALRWFCEWNFNARNAAHTLGMLKVGLSGCDIKIKWEHNKQVFFISIIKVR